MAANAKNLDVSLNVLAAEGDRTDVVDLDGRRPEGSAASVATGVGSAIDGSADTSGSIVRCAHPAASAICSDGHHPRLSERKKAPTSD
jgi:hypothetical protein